MRATLADLSGYQAEYKTAYTCKSHTKLKEKYFISWIPLVSQKLIPNLKHDYKVLVFYDLIFVLKRNVRGG